jgi:threonine/homoserine/homoserine lactone efflux protein
LEQYLALFTFAFIAAWTPGPNNMILMSSGLAHGFRRTLPLIFGVGIGFPFMIGVLGLGLDRVFDQLPYLYTVMKFAGSAYVIWLAWKIASSIPSADAATSNAKPLTFVQAAAFQWINPKGWMMALTVLSANTIPSNYAQSLFLIVATFVLMGFTSASAWTVFGTGLRQIMNNPRFYRWINFGLAAALLASMLPIWLHS